MGRRRFSHLHAELSLAVGALVPRYALWLCIKEHGWDPDGLSREAALAFSAGPLPRFLAGRGLALRPRSARRLTRALSSFDPRRPTPDEVLERLAAG